MGSLGERRGKEWAAGWGLRVSRERYKDAEPWRSTDTVERGSIENEGSIEKTHQCFKVLHQEP